MYNLIATLKFKGEKTYYNDVDELYRLGVISYTTYYTCRIGQ